jgi:hypothetical protein
MLFEKRSCTLVQRASEDSSATRSRFGDVPYLSQPRWRKYRKGAIALTTIRPSDQP